MSPELLRYSRTDGGIAPLGYETRDREITVVEEQAERVRPIFRRYLELGSPNHLMADLRERGVGAGGPRSTGRAPHRSAGQAPVLTRTATSHSASMNSVR
jgi:hypothetical protein